MFHRFYRSFETLSSYRKQSFQKPYSIVSQWFGNLPLQYKVGLSFGLAISVASIGVATGWLITESYLDEARTNIEDSEAEYRILSDLKVDFLRMHLHQKGAILTLSDLSQWSEVYATFAEDQEQFNAIWSNYQETYGAMHSDALHAPKEQELIKKLIASYSAFSRDLDTLTDRLDRAVLVKLSDAERRTLQAELTRFNNQKLRQDAYRFLDLVEELRDNSDARLGKAKLALENASNFRVRMVVLSTTTSLFITFILLFILSRAISSSIKQASEIAEQVIKTSSFNLRIPVVSSDEVGKLSTVLNRLILQVKQLLKQEKEKSESLQNALKELQSTQSILIQNEKMSALGEMVAGIAHEINNPVNFIHGNLPHLESYLQDLSKLIQFYQRNCSALPTEIYEEIEDLDIPFLIDDSMSILKSMKIGTQRISEIVLSLRNFSRLDEAEIKLVDLHEGLDNSLIILAHRLRGSARNPQIEIVKNYGSIPKVECYAGQMNQVFMNILSNAIDALQENRQQYSGQKTQPIPGRICISTEMLGNTQVRIRIKDNGPGIPDDIIDRLFDPFFTTKEVGKGTGLGLSISYKIVTEKHQGTLQCHSHIGQGTEFVIQIPVHQSEMLDYPSSAISQRRTTAVL